MIKRTTFTPQRQATPRRYLGGRIWPFGDLLGVLPHQVVFAEEEEGAVDR